jgi:hypothetical protein
MSERFLQHECNYIFLYIAAINKKILDRMVICLSKLACKASITSARLCCFLLSEIIDSLLCDNLTIMLCWC